MVAPSASPPLSPVEPPNPHEASVRVAVAARATAAPNRSDFFMCIAFLTVWWCRSVGRCHSVTVRVIAVPWEGEGDRVSTSRLGQSSGPVDGGAVELVRLFVRIIYKSRGSLQGFFVSRHTMIESSFKQSQTCNDLIRKASDMTEPQPGAHMRAELTSQPETWARAADLRDAQALLPASGARVAVVGCGTSWFMAQSYARAARDGRAGRDRRLRGIRGRSSTAATTPSSRSPVRAPRPRCSNSSTASRAAFRRSA